MSHFRLLKDPDNYAPHDWDLLADEAGRRYWLDHFDTHFVQTLQHARSQYGRSGMARVEAAGKEFAEAIGVLRQKPDGLPGGKLDIIELDRLRGRILRKHKLDDPFAHVKARENDYAIGLYAEHVHDVHSLHGPDRWLRLMECIFAGNVFDMGAMPTMRMADDPPDFYELLDQIKPRPWFADDFDALAEQLQVGPPCKWTKAVVFIDNAGSDFVLGLMPLIRELALGGTQIVLAANELPALNDMTVEETVDVVGRLAANDPDLTALIQGRMIEVVSSGNDIPLVDLSDVADELNAAAEDADLLILEGMGRAVESNFDTPFTVDAIRLAILKDEAVAAHVGAEMFDCVCKYTPV